jgi:ADP-heptose:LPS heptosyltransferase
METKKREKKEGNRLRKNKWAKMLQQLNKYPARFEFAYDVHNTGKTAAATAARAKRR